MTDSPATFSDNLGAYFQYCQQGIDNLLADSDESHSSESNSDIENIENWTSEENSDESDSEEELYKEVEDENLNLKNFVKYYHFLKLVLKRVEDNAEEHLEKYKLFTQNCIEKLRQNCKDGKTEGLNLFEWKAVKDIHSMELLKKPKVYTPTIQEAGGIERWLRGLMFDEKVVFVCSHFQPMLPIPIYVKSKYDKRKNVMSYSEQRGIWCELCRTVYLSMQSMYGILFHDKQEESDNLLSDDDFTIEPCQEQEKKESSETLSSSDNSSVSDSFSEEEDSSEEEESNESINLNQIKPCNTSWSSAEYEKEESNSYLHLPFPHLISRLLLPFGNCPYLHRDSYENNSILEEDLDD